MFKIHQLVINNQNNSTSPSSPRFISTDTITVGSGSDPIITTISTDTVDVFGGKIVKLTGSNFNPSSGYTQVHIDSDLCSVISIDTTFIECILPEGPPGVKKMSVVQIDGYSSTPVNITYVLNVDTVTPSQGSYAGGLELTIHGDGFGVNVSSVDVKVGQFDCKVSEVKNTTIKCKQPASTRTVNIDSSGKDDGKFILNIVQLPIERIKMKLHGA